MMAGRFPAFGSRPGVALCGCRSMCSVHEADAQLPGQGAGRPEFIISVAPPAKCFFGDGWILGNSPARRGLFDSIQQVSDLAGEFRRIGLGVFHGFISVSSASSIFASLLGKMPSNMRNEHPGLCSRAVLFGSGLPTGALLPGKGA